MINVPVPIAIGIGAFLRFQKTGIKMLEIFIELTDQIFWEGYARQLEADNPAQFQYELNEFLKSYQ